MPKEKLSPAQKAHKTRNKTYSKIRESILLIDCTLKGEEKCSETEFLEKYFQIINHQLRSERKKEVEVDTEKKYSPKKLKDLLKTADYYSIHISSHGNVDKKKNTFLDLRYGKLYSKDLMGLWEEYPKIERPLVIVLSACCAGHKDLIEALSNNGCRYCIAPVFPTDWEYAALFSTFFYTYLFLRRMRPVTAFRKAIRSLPELNGKWKMFDYGKEVRS